MLNKNAKFVIEKNCKFLHRYDRWGTLYIVLGKLNLMSTWSLKHNNILYAKDTYLPNLHLFDQNSMYNMYSIIINTYVGTYTFVMFINFV